ncbi:hypothetical protein B0H14DRAFT_2592006 [Mycena olivaceomarginata]|nr:hypothetical protein B0H14DRAFT_2592006 [Mycena olivaceomarginata]
MPLSDVSALSSFSGIIIAQRPRDQRFWNPSATALSTPKKFCGCPSRFLLMQCQAATCSGVPDWTEIPQTMENDPAIVDRSLCDQLQQVIIEPCRKLTHPLAVIIGGLDECDGKDIQREILRSIGNSVFRGHLPIRFFISSRPESHIRETLADPRLDRIFEFRGIHREHWTMAAVASPWPSSEIVEYLVQKSSGYFIYASTVVKFIDDKRFRPVGLDQLYRQILSDVPSDLGPKLIEILAVTLAKILIGEYWLPWLFGLALAFSGFGLSWLWPGLGFIKAKAKAKLFSLPKAMAPSQAKPKPGQSQQFCLAWLEILRGQGQAKKPKPKPEHH